MKQIFTLFFCSIIYSLYSSNSPVVQLKANDFKKIQKEIWLVEFYAPWCGHCQKLAPQYQKAAKALKGIMNVGAIDATSQQTGVQISGYPTIKFIKNGKITDYNGGRTARQIVEFMLQQAKKIAFEKLGQKTTTQDNNNQGTDQKDVIVLDQKNFEQNVFKSDDAWFLEFYAPWCGHCKNLKPQWAKLATMLKGEVKVAKIDATQNSNLAKQFGVSGYPTIKFYNPGPKSYGQQISYDGNRDAQSMQQWALQKLLQTKPIQIKELDSQELLQNACANKHLCFITFFSRIQKDQRQKHIQIIKEVAKKPRKIRVHFIWVQQGKFPHFQNIFRIGGTGYPVALAISDVKKVFQKMLKSFGQETFVQWVNDVFKNKGRFTKYQALQLVDDSQL